MPYVDLVSGNDRVSLWYITNTNTSNASSFDPLKPTVIMLHPLFLDSEWMASQMEDPRLNSNYNIIAFDSRSCGKSRCRFSAAHDSWVEAADLAFAHQALQLPPAHILAIEVMSVNVALRFAALFPDMCKSLTLVNVPPPADVTDTFETYEEMMRMWCFPTDLDEFEHACLELSQLMLGNDCEPDLQDEIISHWVTRSPPWRRSRTYETVMCVLNRTALKREELAAITQPTLIIQAEFSAMNPTKYAYQLAEDLINAEGGAKVQAIKGSPEYVTVIPTCASIVNRMFHEFLSRQPHKNASSLANRPPMPVVERMQAALVKLSKFAGDPAIADRDPRSSTSFSRVSDTVKESQTAKHKRCRENEKRAFSPLGQDGRPVRRFSERYKDHWFHPDKDGSSRTYSLGSLPVSHGKEKKRRAGLEPIHGTFVSDTVMDRGSPTDTMAIARSSRNRQVTVGRLIVEKTTIGPAGGFSSALPKALAISKMIA